MENEIKTRIIVNILNNFEKNEIKIKRLISFLSYLDLAKLEKNIKTKDEQVISINKKVYFYEEDLTDYNKNEELLKILYYDLYLSLIGEKIDFEYIFDFDFDEKIKDDNLVFNITKQKILKLTSKSFNIFEDKNINIDINNIIDFFINEDFKKFDNKYNLSFNNENNFIYIFIENIKMVKLKVSKNNITKVENFHIDIIKKIYNISFEEQSEIIELITNYFLI